jgi:transposase
MIRSSKLSLKFVNKEKQNKIALFIKEYTNLVSLFIDKIWDLEKIPNLLTKEITDSISSKLSARAKQAAGKQASSIVRGTRRKQEKRLYIINKLINENKIEEANKLQEIYNNITISKPNINTINPLLDSRFIKIELNNTTKEFDVWLTLGSTGIFKKVCIPLKKTKHFNKLMSKGKLCNSIVLSNKDISFCFEIEKSNNINTTNPNILGIDIGKNKVISCSNGYTSTKNKDGYDLNVIIDKMSKQKIGSKAYNRSKKHRLNYINYCINKLDLTGVTEVRIENIKNLKLGRKRLGKLIMWTYRDIFKKITTYCEEQNVSVKKVSSSFTSRRCSCCGWVQKENRNGEFFKCLRCGFENDADINAAINISLDLENVMFSKSSNGFYWKAIGQESIVPANPKTYRLNKFHKNR